MPSGAGLAGASRDCCLCGLGGWGEGEVVTGVCAGGDGRREDVGRVAASRNGAGGSFGVAWMPVSSLAYCGQPKAQWQQQTLQ